MRKVLVLESREGYDRDSQMFDFREKIEDIIEADNNHSGKVIIVTIETSDEVII